MSQTDLQGSCSLLHLQTWGGLVLCQDPIDDLEANVVMQWYDELCVSETEGNTWGLKSDML